jgi:predicted DNA-binding protein (MmcQ/YjbR family)
MMNVEDIRSYCIVKDEVTEGFPFGESTLVFKVKGKIFLLVGLDSSPLQFNAKCDPERALALREEHDWIIPGYHMNKKHWNSIIIEQRPDRKLIRELIDHSYELVAGKKPKARSIK